MTRMSEVLNIRVVKNAFYDASNDSWICAFVDEEKAQHAAHAIKHVDALADALQFLLDEYIALANSGDAGNWSAEETPEGMKAIAALAAYRGDK